METCERCYRLIERPEEHGYMLCPLEPRQANGIIPDGIPGGILIKHGICNEDGTPRRYDSRTEIRRAAKAKGLTWGYDENRHVPVPGTDKSPHTRRW